METESVSETNPQLLTLPCDICGEPVPVKSRFTEWAAHWACALLGRERIKELKAQHPSAGEQHE